MNYLLDTNPWSYLQRRHPAVVDRVRALPSDCTVYMPVVSQAELLAGVEITAEGSRKLELRRLYEQLVSEFAEVLPIDSVVAEHFASIVAQLRRNGTPIGTNDIRIGSIAKAHDLTVVTNDAHFQRIEGLRTENWMIS